MTEFVNVSHDDIAQAWLHTTLEVAAAPEQKSFHSVTRIRDTAGDGEPRIHRAASDLLGEFDLQPLGTVANTIFPAEMAAQTPAIDALTARYEAIYPQLRRLYRANLFGTYFHRLVAFPGPKGPENQLERVITNLRGELSSRSPKRARYEMSLESPSDDAAIGGDVAGDADGDASSGSTAGATSVFAPGRDTRSMGFPCLSLLSFQQDRTHLHAVAHYRSQHLLERGLGNYLGIARLMRYLAEQVGLQPGALTIVAGQACADHLRKSHILDLAALRSTLSNVAPTSATCDLKSDGR
ncbi:hypothetical protein [Mycobacterium riyadhense]|uniref:hypothetical protein n=1 Tax=Mycobacterium riyadhense TaxID=486698 RepID=UPI00195D8E21|nr:hypothetical protein [Mycobacterium riyadhense]